MYTSMICSDKTNKHYTGGKSEILRILTLTSVTLVKVKGHMTLVRNCGLHTSITLSHNHLDIYSYVLNAADNSKYVFFVTFDLENAPNDPQIHRLRLRPITYYGAKYHLPGSLHVRKKWETDTQTHTQTHRQTEPIIL